MDGMTKSRGRERVCKKKRGVKPPQDCRYGAPKRNLLHTIAMFFLTLRLKSRRTSQKYMRVKKTTFPQGHVTLKKVILMPMLLQALTNTGKVKFHYLFFFT